MNPSSLKLRRTGKLILLCTMLCVNQLYGMEPIEPEQKQKDFFQWLREFFSGEAIESTAPEGSLKSLKKYAVESGEEVNLSPKVEWKNLPNEVKLLVLTEVYKYDNPLNAINAIKALSVTNKELNKIINMQDEKDFFAIVDFLAQKIMITPSWCEKYPDFYEKYQETKTNIQGSYQNILNKWANTPFLSIKELNAADKKMSKFEEFWNNNVIISLTIAKKLNSNMANKMLPLLIKKFEKENG